MKKLYNIMIISVLVIAIIGLILYIKIYCDCLNPKTKNTQVESAKRTQEQILLPNSSLTINGANIDVKLEMDTESDTFKYYGVPGDAFTLEDAYGNKAIVFMYYDSTDPNNEDDNPSAAHILKPVFSVKKPAGWVSGDEVDIFPFNEKDVTMFNNLKDTYFMERLAFANKPLKPEQKPDVEKEYEIFNCNWNSRHTGALPIYPACCCDTSVVVHEIALALPQPRYTRDGGILTLH